MNEGIEVMGQLFSKKNREIFCLKPDFVSGKTGFH